MKFPLATSHRAASALRRHGALAAVAMLALAAFIAMAAVGVSDWRSDRSHAAEHAAANAADRANAILDRQQRGLDRLAMLTAAAPDAGAQQFLDQIGDLAPGIRAAAIADANGTVELRDRTGRDDTALAFLAADAVRQLAAHPDRTLLVTLTATDGDNTLVGLARPWRAAGGNLGGLALVAIDHAAFPGLDLARADGTPLFTNDGIHGTQSIALDSSPLILRYAAPENGFWTRHGGWPFVALAIVGAAAVLAAIAMLAARLAAARREGTRLVALENELREGLAAAAESAGRIDELSRSKSQFFAQVTHELRTPLNAILGFSETIRQEMFGPVANPRYLEYAGLIHAAGAHLLSLINDLLDEARLEAGKMEIAPIRVAAPALARSALDLVELLADGRDIALATTGLSSCADLSVDPRAMKQVLVNLLSNAIKYTPPGGRIELRFLMREDDGVAIEIADTGIGMSPEDLAVAFEPFGRAGGIEARRQQGTGLGLVLARALVRLHGGDLTLASEPDHGTTATVILPSAAVFATQSSRVPAEAA